MRYHYTPVRMAKIQNTDNTKCWQGYRAIIILIHCWWECNMGQLLWKTVWWFLIKLNTLLPYDLAIAFFGIYPNELKTYVHTKTQMFLAALFITAQTWKQPRCPSVGEWINKLRYIQTMEYYLALKRNEFELFVMRWMDLESVIQSE